MVRVGPDVDRGQLVLVAAAVVVIGLAPVLLAYLQLGYHPDVADEPEITGERAVEYLDRSVHRASAAHAGEYRWRDRRSMADAIRDDIDGDLETLERSRLESGVVYDVAYNASAASAWSERNCTAGDGKRFGPCETYDGVVVQERAGEAVLLAVAFDVSVVGPDGRSELTVVVEVGA